MRPCLQSPRARDTRRTMGRLDGVAWLPRSFHSGKRPAVGWRRARADGLGELWNVCVWDSAFDFPSEIGS